VTICRIQGRITSVTLFMLVGGLLELILSALGAHVGGLTGLSLGWVTGVCLEAVLMASTVYRAAAPV
jgi:hypothetical protein